MFKYFKEVLWLDLVGTLSDETQEVKQYFLVFVNVLSYAVSATISAAFSQYIINIFEYGAFYSTHSLTFT